MVHRPFHVPLLLAVLSAVSLPGVAHAASAANSLFLPRGKAETRHATTGCDAFGQGFVKVEGTDTCVHLGGSVRVETSIATGSTRH